MELPLILQFDAANIHVDVQIKHTLCLLHDNSGSGKTYLFSLLEYYCLENGISYRRFDYNSCGIPASRLIQDCGNVDILLLDNADLYMTSEFYAYLKGLNKIILISHHNLLGITGLSRDNVYKVSYVENRVSLKSVR